MSYREINLDWPNNLAFYLLLCTTRSFHNTKSLRRIAVIPSARQSSAWISTLLRCSRSDRPRSVQGSSQWLYQACFQDALLAQINPHRHYKSASEIKSLSPWGKNQWGYILNCKCLRCLCRSSTSSNEQTLYYITFTKAFFRVQFVWNVCCLILYTKLKKGTEFWTQIPIANVTF
jgi:hypothetical protein